MPRLAGYIPLDTTKLLASDAAADDGFGWAVSCLADLTNDGIIDIFDVFAFLDSYSTGCP